MESGKKDPDSLVHKLPPLIALLPALLCKWGVASDVARH